MEARAKLFKNGRSQAVRLPKEFRFEGDEVKVSKVGKKVILEPIDKKTWPPGFWNMFKPDSDFQIPEPLPSTPISMD